MYKTSSTKVRNYWALGAAASITLIISVGAYFLNNDKPRSINKAEAMAQYIVDEMPDSPLRNNLMTVFGAEYAGASQELNEILNAYAQMKVRELNKGL